MAEFSGFSGLMALIRRLRGEDGCPWDRKQTPRSMAGYLLEEAYELSQAVASEKADAVCEELGDVLFQLFFIAALYGEAGRFTMEAVTRTVTEKMIRRHPHVFGEAAVDGPEGVSRQWHEIKQRERGSRTPGDLLSSIPLALPALVRTHRVTDRVARSGLGPEGNGLRMEGLREKWSDLERSLSGDGEPPADRAALAERFGDLLFALADTARRLRINPETALADALRRFEEKFDLVASAVSERREGTEGVSEEELERLWATAGDQGRAEAAATGGSGLDSTKLSRLKDR